MNKPLAILAFAAGLGLIPSGWTQPVDILPQLDPGVIMHHYWMDQQYRFNQPWLYQPIAEQDLRPVDVEALIEIQQPNVSAKIVRPEDMTPVIHIRKLVQ